MRFSVRFEYVFAAFVLVIFVSFCGYLLIGPSGFSAFERCYNVKAVFSDSGGMEIGSPVRVAGVSVGYVSSLKLDTDSYLVLVSMCIDDNIKLSTSSVFKITGGYLLGGNVYVDVIPGDVRDGLISSDGDAVVINTQYEVIGHDAVRSFLRKMRDKLSK